MSLVGQRLGWPCLSPKVVAGDGGLLSVRIVLGVRGLYSHDEVRMADWCANDVLPPTNSRSTARF
jgi:hypothetical protein